MSKRHTVESITLMIWDLIPEFIDFNATMYDYPESEYMDVAIETYGYKFKDFNLNKRMLIKVIKLIQEFSKLYTEKCGADFIGVMDLSRKLFNRVDKY